MIDIKQELYNQCLNYAQKSMDAAQQAINEAQDTNRNLAQLNEANKLKIALTLVSTGSTSSTAETGSVVSTNNGNFYIAISAGVLTANGENYFAVSPASPIGMKLKARKTGDEFALNGKIYVVKGVF
jgi:type V secretory pathway adhesin AidA